jgi:hypothetical protein
MDPYLEKYWLEVHPGLIIYTRDYLRTQLPQGLRARIEDRVFVVPEEGDRHSIHPDVYVVEHQPGKRGSLAAVTGIAVAEPIIVQREDEPISQGYLEIVDVASGNRVVTVIEYVSPTNKLAGDGRVQYLEKQKEVIDAGANLVEIDLTRAGNRCLAVSESRISARYRSHYIACVTRASNRLFSEVYPLYIAKPLPSIRIPLREGDTDIALDLQSLIDRCYENGDYDMIDYREPPKPPLDPEGAAWAEKWLREKGLRD